MAQFIEERLAVEIDYGGSFSENHAVDLVTTVGGDEYRSLRHPYVVLSYDISYERNTKFVRDKVIDLYARCNGRFRGFRVKDHKDFTTRNYVESPTAMDQPMVAVSPGVYQMMRWYGLPTDPLAARRRIRKPVAGTVKVGVGGAVFPSAQWSVDLTTGLVSLSVNESVAISGITKGQTTTLAVPGHNFAVGQSVVISGVSGMPQINGARAVITDASSGSVTVGINSSAFSDYAGGGTAQTRPINGESVTCGTEFDIPCRFDTDLSASFSTYDTLDASGIEIIEILNP